MPFAHESIIREVLLTEGGDTGRVRSVKLYAGSFHFRLLVADQVAKLTTKLWQSYQPVSTGCRVDPTYKGHTKGS